MLTKSIGVALAFVLVAGCGKKDDSNESSSFGKGVLQGVLRNAITGERIPLKSGDKKDGVYAIVKSKQVVAKTQITQEDAGDKNKRDETLVGEYVIQGLPVDVEIPVIVNVEGYELFEGRVNVYSTVAQRTPKAGVKDIDLAHPIVNADIRLVPRGEEAKDVEILVVDSNDIPVAGAVVVASLTGNLAQDKQGTTTTNGYFTGSISRASIVNGKTDDEGKFSISGADLAVARQYAVVVYPPQLKQQEASATFTVAFRGSAFGLTNPTDEKEPNVVKIVVQPKTPTP
jgi:hypothetical protein